MDPSTITFDEWRKWMKKILRESPDSGKIWDLMCAQRGPDSPSERPDMSPYDHSVAYDGRRARKRATVEVIRANSFGGMVGGCARSRAGDSVILPSRNTWDHFDRHVATAAGWLGLKVITND